MFETPLLLVVWGISQAGYLVSFEFLKKASGCMLSWCGHDFLDYFYNNLRN
jgi:hypothetical protein